MYGENSSRSFVCKLMKCSIISPPKCNESENRLETNANHAQHDCCISFMVHTLNKICLIEGVEQFSAELAQDVTLYMYLVTLKLMINWLSARPKYE